MIHRPGQWIDKNPSDEYIDAAISARDWSLENPEK